ncbi:MAG: AMP-binding protein, partial [SAR324 cluster bacterium]|nr:AMP-binding protein [SAR324 cluster bacterium]
MNLVELADQNIKKFGEITKVIYEDQKYTNLQLIQEANQLAHGLIDLGIKPGDKVLVLLLNSPQVLVSYQGILRAGASIIPVIFLLGPKEVAHILRNSEASAIITTKAFLNNVTQAREGIKSLKHIIIVEDEEIPETVSLKSVLHNRSKGSTGLAIKDDDNAVILYTSGTTGVPKGVMLTHRNLYANAVSSYDLDSERSPDDIGLFVLPLSHSFGLTVMNVGFMFANMSVMIPWFDLETSCRLIEKYKIVGFAAVPAIFSMFLNTPDVVDKYDLSSLNECNSGSAPLPVEVLKGFEEKFGCIIYEGYGLSEAAPIVSAHYKGRQRKVGSIGQPLPGVEVKIVDLDRKEVPVNEVGELIVRGANISPGYYKLPAKTAETFIDGWLYTGDMGKIDQDGYIFIVDRKKDLIIRGGFNILPRDIEEILYQHPAVMDAAVIGVPDKIMGEEVKCYLVISPGATVTEDE